MDTYVLTRSGAYRDGLKNRFYQRYKNSLKMAQRTDVTLDMVKQTSGKVDDVLFQSEQFTMQLSLLLKEVREKYTDEDGTFNDIKLTEVNKWSPIITDIWEGADNIAKETFGSSIKIQTNNPLVLSLLSLFGVPVEFNQNEQV